MGVDIIVVEGIEVGGLNYFDCLLIFVLFLKIAREVLFFFVVVGGFVDG